MSFERFTPRAKKTVELALREALALGHNYIGTEHILLALLREREGVAARILADRVTFDEAKADVVRIHSSARNVWPELHRLEAEYRKLRVDAPELPADLFHPAFKDRVR